jgi:hypothetical protein
MREFDLEKREATDEKIKRLTAGALDDGSLSEEKYVELADGRKIVKIKIPYVSWWITGATDGMVTFTWVAFKQEGVSREEVEDAIANNKTLMIDVSRELERLSAPAVGNG